MQLEEYNQIARQFLDLKNKAKLGGEEECKKYKEYQDFCAKKLAPLVNFRVGKYKQFSNYEDLKQDGFEALMMAFDSYDPEKGCNFLYWARQYIRTKVSRAANAHSTIRFPLKKTKELKPYKVGTIPIVIDDSNSPLDAVEKEQNASVVHMAIAELPIQQRHILLMRYEFDSSISKISKELKISRPTCQKLLNEAEFVLKNKLQNYFDKVEEV